MGKNIDKVTLKDTKQIIFDALTEAKETIKKLESEKLDPAKKAVIKKNKETVEKAEAVMADSSLIEMIHKLRTDGTVKLEDIAEKITTTTSDYESVLEATTVKKAELKDLFNIEEAMFDLVAIVNAKEELKEKYEADYTNAKEEKDEYLKEIQEQVKTEIEDKKTEIDTLNSEFKKQREREEEEWKYSFDRAKMKAQNELDDSLLEQRKSHNEEIKSENLLLAEREDKVSKREDEMTEKENEFNSLKEKVEAFPKELEQVKSEAKENGKKEAEKTSAIKEASVKRGFEADKKILENEILMYKSDIERKDSQIADLTEKLNKAYAEMREMATSAINASRPTIIRESSDNSKSSK